MWANNMKYSQVIKIFSLSLVVVLFFYNCPLLAQVPTLDWVRSPEGRAISRSVAESSTGDVYVSGAFYSDLNFDTTITLTTTGFGDMFIANYDENGRIVWAKKATGNYGDEARCLETGDFGHVYVAGEFFSNDITFDSLTLINNHITPYHDEATKDIFLVKYNQSGQVIWAKSGGGINMEFVRDIVVDSRENITIVGTFWSPSVTFGSYTLTKTGNIDVFIVQYDSSGQVLWAKNPEATNQENAYSVAADTVGNVYMAGSFNSDSIRFDNITLICSSESFDTYIVEYDPSGNAIWAENAHGNDWDEANSVALDKSGNIYLSGHFKSDSIEFGSEILQISAANNIDMFLVKYDPNYQVVWARRSGGNIWSWVYPYEIAVEPQGNIWMTGVFIGDGLIFNSTILPNHGSYDIYIAQYNKFGAFLWAESIGGEGMDWGQGLTAPYPDNCYLTGYFESSYMVIGDTSLSNTPNHNKAFLVRMINQATKINPQKDKKDSFNLGLINYPNPFNLTTQIEFSINKSRFIELKIFNILGEEVATLVSDRLSAGSYSYEWDATNLASGVYIYRLQAGDYVETKKMVLMR
jgi:hypothetical protein